MSFEYKCLLCDRLITSDQITLHKQKHADTYEYATLWPINDPFIDFCYDVDIPIYSSKIIADTIGVKKVYILDEGYNYSGSMKDYLVKRSIDIGIKNNIKFFNVASSGNHAISLAKLTQLYDYKAVIFIPASSVKIKLLSSFDNILIIGVRNSNYEDVYSLSNQLDIEGLFNANASNEILIPGLQTVSRQICSLSPQPTHILAGVGNGTYLSGITWGLEHTINPIPKIVPVGMNNAFPFENALFNKVKIFKKKSYDITNVYEAVGSIAVESFNSPHLYHCIKLSNGFVFGNLINNDLRKAYLLLMNDINLTKKCVIPEPTGIMGLAAALKYKKAFTGDDILLISFTGHALTSILSIKRLIPEIYNTLIASARINKKNFSFQINNNKRRNIIYIDKDIKMSMLKTIVQNWMCQ